MQPPPPSLFNKCSSCFNWPSLLDQHCLTIGTLANITKHENDDSVAILFQLSMRNKQTITTKKQNKTKKYEQTNKKSNKKQVDAGGVQADVPA